MIDNECRGASRRANEALNEKQALLQSKLAEREKIRGDMNEMLALFREKQIKRETFASLFAPLEERLAQVNAVLPKLQAEVDLAKVDELSVDAILDEAKTLHDAWPKLAGEEKRQVVESITERIVIGESEIEITLSGCSPCKELTKRQHVRVSRLLLPADLPRSSRATRKPSLTLNSLGRTPTLVDTRIDA